MSRSEQRRLLKKQGDRKTTGDKALEEMEPLGWKYGVVYMVLLKGTIFLLKHWEILEECFNKKNHTLTEKLDGKQL